MFVKYGTSRWGSASQLRSPSGVNPIFPRPPNDVRAKFGSSFGSSSYRLQKWPVEQGVEVFGYSVPPLPNLAVRLQLLPAAVADIIHLCRPRVQRRQVLRNPPRSLKHHFHGIQRILRLSMGNLQWKTLQWKTTCLSLRNLISLF